MKKIISILSILLIACFALTSCGSFSTAEDGKIIKAITTKEEKDGTIKMVISYTDEELANDGSVELNRRLQELANDDFILPRGVTGNGIKSIFTYESLDKTGIVIRVNYTDETIEPTEFTLLHGKNGVDGISIAGIETTVNEETGETTVTITYTDEEKEPVSFTIPKGEKGETGRGILSIEKTYSEELNDVYTITFTDNTSTTYTISNGKDGKDGIYITDIIGTTTSTEYIVKFIFSDKTTKEITLEKPSTNKWISGSSFPKVDVGNDNDYYFDTYHKIIYTKRDGVWTLVISFNDSQETYKVIFNLNDKTDGGPEASMPAGFDLPYCYIQRNTYFKQNGYGNIPVPTREGYTFLGWYTTKTIGPTSGVLTDLTPILSDLELYAQWAKK